MIFLLPIPGFSGTDYTDRVREIKGGIDRISDSRFQTGTFLWALGLNKVPLIPFIPAGK
jgi:hypothetical protein